MPAVNTPSNIAIKAALRAGQGADKPKGVSDGNGNGLYLEVRPGVQDGGGCDISSIRKSEC